MRISRPVLALTCVLLATGAVARGQQPKYGVSVKVAKTAVLAKATTYSWIVSQPSPIKSTDALIVAAVDRELAARGYTKVDAKASQVLATYGAIRRTDVDVKADKDGARPERPVGTLVVDLRDPATRQPVFRVRMDTPVDLAGDKAKTQIDAAVAAMFAEYPSRDAAKQ